MFRALLRSANDSGHNQGHSEKNYLLECQPPKLGKIVAHTRYFDVSMFWNSLKDFKVHVCVANSHSENR